MKENFLCVFGYFKVCILKNFEKIFHLTIVKVVKNFVEENFGKKLACQTSPSFQLICVYILSIFFPFFSYTLHQGYQDPLLVSSHIHHEKLLVFQR